MSSGPCGACKYLRRKCVKGCIFAPYFDTEQGMSHFAAVHKVFGASNASKLLLSIPANRRLETVITLCYEALARVRDPVYGSVAHIFTLQQQVVTLQAELAYVQARLSTLQSASSELAATTYSYVSMDPLFDTTVLHHVLDQQLDNCDLHSVARDFHSTL
ncbi:PREDICTED: LOB domain-containing protein 19-like [Nicotiana attenuata]|uniref:Lob domain-containing protein 19 n=1 Tax=Nicotiana attenuata TaxID=49451 RepID=A0A314KV28_NICAT|nr:PREDICTED: LOB domain-containing protein 19-like [Nicotiana attenuata]OIT33246.1 lob domain-containing protein 19 [Nicotiana attenuata]